MEDRTLLTIQFQFDFSLDRNGFFASSARQEVLKLAGRMLGERLNDSLSAIVPSGSNTWKASVTNPATGGTTTFTNPTLSSNTIRIYAGGRDLSSGTLGIGGGGGYSSFGSSAWNTLVKTRGQSGVSAGSDVSPRIGSIVFDTVGTSWFFGTTSSGRSGSQSDFLSVAIHELGHVLGINSGNPSWTQFISGGVFNGSNVKAANGGRAVGIDPGRGHFANGTGLGGLEAAMDPSITTGTRKLFGKLDFAALADIGWSVGTSNDTIYRAPEVLVSAGSAGASFSATGALDNATDVDIFRVYVAAGRKLSVSVRAKTGGTKVDTFLKLYDLSGSLLKSNDSGGTGGTDSFSNFAVTRSDYYYVAISSFAGRNYSPFVPDSGARGPVGDYSYTISTS